MKQCLAFLLTILLCFGCLGCEAFRSAAQTAAPAQQAETTPFSTPGTVEEELAPVVQATETAIPMPTPIPTPTPSPTPTPTPTPEPTKDPNRPMVALTFDDGPNLTLTIPVLEKLKEYGVKATFFVLASAINDQSGPMLQMMVDDGHEIGVHGWNHERMTNFTASENTKRFEKAINKISGWIEGGYTPKLMRPPGGHKNGTVQHGAKDAGLAVIMWSVDTRDWESKNVEKIMEIVKKETKNGSIILCHDHHKPTLDALDVMIPWLLEQGYELVTVSELLESSSDGLVPGKVYYKKTVE